MSEGIEMRAAGIMGTGEAVIPAGMIVMIGIEQIPIKNLAVMSRHTGTTRPFHVYTLMRNIIIS